MPDTHIVASLAPAIREDFHLPPRATRPRPDATLDALLRLEGTAFTEAAYLAVLGRAPDPSGAAYQRAELARGTAKLELLARLQDSAEARASGRRLAGIPALRRRFRLIRSLGRRLRHRSNLQQQERENRFDALQSSIDALRRDCDTRLAEHAGVMDGASHRIASLTAAAEAAHRRSADALDNQDRLLAAVAGSCDTTAGQLAETERTTMAAILSLSEEVRSQAASLAGVGGDPALIAAKLAAAAASVHTGLLSRIAAAESVHTSLLARVAVAEATVETNRRDVAGQQHRIGLMLHALRDRTPTTVQAEDDHSLDELYLAFEDRFRGTRADIKQRQAVYLPRLSAAGAGTPARPVLDIGAGRGEFLELLLDAGMAGQGVDMSAAMVTQCREAGLACTQGDALDHLAATPDGALGAITGFHIVEHLPFKMVVRLLDEALRALAPGGLIIFETPNPANILVASRWFHLDPTHRNPLPGEMLAMIAEARGFTAVEILPLHPMRQSFPGADRHLAESLDLIFHGPQDYALIAGRP